MTAMERRTAMELMGSGPFSAREIEDSVGSFFSKRH